MNEETNLALTNAVDKQLMQWTNTGILKVIKQKIRHKADRCTSATLHNLTSLKARDTREEVCTIATCFRSKEVSISVYFLHSVLGIQCLCFVPFHVLKFFNTYFQLIYRIVFKAFFSTLTTFAPIFKAARIFLRKVNNL